MIGAIGTSGAQSVRLDELTTKIMDGEEEQAELAKKLANVSVQTKVAEAGTQTNEDALSQLLA